MQIDINRQKVLIYFQITLFQRDLHGRLVLKNLQTGNTSSYDVLQNALSRHNQTFKKLPLSENISKFY